METSTLRFGSAELSDCELVQRNAGGEIAFSSRRCCGCWEHAHLLASGRVSRGGPVLRSRCVDDGSCRMTHGAVIGDPFGEL